jgi:hypothetical protein
MREKVMFGLLSLAYLAQIMVSISNHFPLNDIVLHSLWLNNTSLCIYDTCS